MLQEETLMDECLRGDSGMMGMQQRHKELRPKTFATPIKRLHFLSPQTSHQAGWRSLSEHSGLLSGFEK
jgi:hypothetical protein